ncbi:hypothetical protein PHMEG_0002334 [Phytophthora megakarya]|uniref:Uncharacterized protein n=1 Tax=Phytophthora megakarya TaxID=4795 RepID=A0A225X101_9STRA|nr:hypothetical protein PHMEG_0002334 [Phytophthora megakarya]
MIEFLRVNRKYWNASTLMDANLPLPEAQMIIEEMKSAKQHKIAVRNNLCRGCYAHDALSHFNCMRKMGWFNYHMHLENEYVDLHFSRDWNLAKGVDPPSGKLSGKDKDIPRNLVNHFVTPIRIRNSLAWSNSGAMPALNKIQNIVAYHRKSKIYNSDDMDVVEKLIWLNAYCGSEEDTQPCSFSINKRQDGKLLLGDGTDSDVFC